MIVTEGEEVAGAWPYFHRHRFGGILPTLDKPPFTLFCGPWISSPPKGIKPAGNLSRHHRLLTTLSQGLPNRRFIRATAPYQFTNAQPLIKQGWQIRQFYSYRLRTDVLSPAELWDNLSGRVRTDVRKPVAAEGEIRSSNDPALFRDLYQKLARKRGVKNILSYPTFKRLFTTSLHLDRAHSWTYYLRDYGPVAAIWLPYDKKSAYLLGAAADPELLTQTKAMTHLIWHAVQWCTERKLIFDFEGSYLPGVEEYYRSFGPEVTSYLQLVRNRLIR
ncbi:MAG: GNAT family N-acetyltransferase [Bacteroidota bacterium]